MRFHIIQLAVATFSLAACSDGNDLNEDTIRLAIDGNIDHFTCKHMWSNALGIRFGITSNANSIDDIFPLSVPAQGAGTKKQPAINLRYLAGQGFFTETRQGGYSSFALTETGRKIFRFYRVKRLMENDLVILGPCYGTGEVETILDFTIPSETGLQVSQVKFNWKASDEAQEIVPLAKNGSAFQIPYYPQSRNAAENSFVPVLSGTGTATVRLTNDGWTVVKVEKD